MDKVTASSIGKPSIMQKIKAHAFGSLYRMNAQTADCYGFNVDADGNDFEGGWDWSKQLVDTNADYILMLDGSGYYKV